MRHSPITNVHCYEVRVGFQFSAAVVLWWCMAVSLQQVQYCTTHVLRRETCETKDASVRSRRNWTPVCRCTHTAQVREGAGGGGGEKRKRWARLPRLFFLLSLSLSLFPCLIRWKQHAHTQSLAFRPRLFHSLTSLLPYSFLLLFLLLFSFIIYKLLPGLIDIDHRRRFNSGSSL